MQITMNTVLEVGSHEALVRQAYLDSEGNWTWSVGLTDATGHLVGRYIGKPQTLEHCMKIYIWALRRYAEQVRDAFKGHALTESEFAAALSFHWNTGAIGRATWVRQWKRGDIEAARKSIMAWVTPKSLTTRRERERDLFFDGKWHNNGKITEITKLHANNTPDFRSAKLIDIRKTVEKIFGTVTDESVPVDVNPKPVEHPGLTLTPTPQPVAYITIPVAYVVVAGLLLVIAGFILLLVALM